MDTIIFIPGFAGSKLTLNGVEVWPPTIFEYVFGYHRLAELTDPNTQKNGVIDSAFCFPIYQPIDDDLNTIAAALGATKIDFDFDWRQDILQLTMPLLPRRSKRRYANGARSIALVCHSLGGVVARLLLESGTYANEPWLGAIEHFVGICNPHHGSSSRYWAERSACSAFRASAPATCPASPPIRAIRPATRLCRPPVTTGCGGSRERADQHLYDRGRWRVWLGFAQHKGGDTFVFGSRHQQPARDGPISSRSRETST